MTAFPTEIKSVCPLRGRLTDISMMVMVLALFPRLRGLWGKGSTIYSPPALFFFFFFSLTWRLACAHQFHSLGSVQSGSASWGYCGRVFPDELRMGSWRIAYGLVRLISSHTVPGLHSHPTPTSLGQGCMRIMLPAALLVEWPGSFTCHCGNTGVERTPYKSQHRKPTLEKKVNKFSQGSCRNSNSQSFNNESGALPTYYPGSARAVVNRYKMLRGTFISLSN